MKKEAMFYKKIKDRAVQCGLCARRCIISEGLKGFCNVRINKQGKLYSLVYGKLCAIHTDPLTKKPLYHFWLGSKSLSIATVGCNFRCCYCCNIEISQAREIYGEHYIPEQIVDLAIQQKCQGISFTYTEPTVFMEYAHDTGQLARRAGLFNTFVTNGYTTPEAIKVAAKWLDAATVDFKAAGDPAFYKRWIQVPNVRPIFDALLEYKKRKVHLEVTNLVVPKLGDDMKKIRTLVRWIKDNLGPDVPLHFLRFFPAGRMWDAGETPVETVEKARQLALKEGMRYVYSGNIPGSEGENTFCPGCGELIIKRAGFETVQVNLKDNRCKKCGEKILIVGKICV